MNSKIFFSLAVILFCINPLFAQEFEPSDPGNIALFPQQNEFRNRLAVFVGVMGGPSEWLGLSDVICINRYWGWYTNVGNLQGAMGYLGGELDMLHNQLKKPIMITEFGADAIAGMHSVEPEIFSEEYQVELIKSFMDVASSREYVVGMHVWNFADFKTGQALMRGGGMNLKGVFTRDRQPKMAAHYLRSRWNENPEETPGPPDN